MCISYKTEALMDLRFCNIVRLFDLLNKKFN